MRYIDLIVQTLAIICGALALIFMRFESWSVGPLLLIQLVLGLWQMGSSLISTLAHTKFYKAKGMHLIVSSFYLIFLYVCFYTTVFNFGDLIFTLLLTIPSWILGFYYYAITWKWVLSRKRHGGKFLPHLSF